MEGWIIDAYADYQRDSLVTWLWTPRGVRRIEDPTYRPHFYVHGRRGDLESMKRRLERLDRVEEVEWASKKIDIRSTEPVPVLDILPRHYRDLHPLAELVNREGQFHDFRLYDVDLRHSQRYFLQHDTLPLSRTAYNGTWKRLEEPFALEYELPPLNAQALDVQVDVPEGLPRYEDRLRAVRLGETVLEGPEEAILEDLNQALREEDPDILLTVNGDPFVLPYLLQKAETHGVDLVLGRERQRFQHGTGKSYFTYGKIVYKPTQYLLRGRLHLDANHFAHRESGLHGLAEMSRLARLVPQEMLRLTPGTAITAMQVNEAHWRGYVVLWKKNLPEVFKTAEELVLCDRGGFILEPQVGIHEGIVEVDYASLYPQIMRTFNISPETIFCPCCKEDGMVAPKIGHHTCVRRRGLIPAYLDPVLERKKYYKRRKKESGPNQAVYAARDCILKWMLVTSFGYQGYKNARYGRIECHEAINAYARELLVRSMHIAETHGYEVVHGIVDSLWLRPLPGHASVEEVVQRIQDDIGLPLDLEGTYRWIVFLPCKTTGVGALNRYYGLLEDGEMKLRGIEVRRHDTPPFVVQAQTGMLEVFRQAQNAREFQDAIPAAIQVLREAAGNLRKGRVPLEDLVISKVVTKPLEDYVVLNYTAAALRQLKARGFKTEPGEYIRYVITDRRTRDYRRKVKFAAFLQEGDTPDEWEYLRLLARSGETLLAPFGYTEGGLLRELS
jgi:DNA polymerase elongation subunit (family B)